jgi:hypothetical protein
VLELNKLVEPPMIAPPALELPPDDDLALALLFAQTDEQPQLDDDPAEEW